MSSIPPENDRLQAITQLLSQITASDPRYLVRKLRGILDEKQPIQPDDLNYVSRWLRTFHELSSASLAGLTVNNLDQVLNAAQETWSLIRQIENLPVPPRTTDSLFEQIRNQYVNHIGALGPAFTWVLRKRLEGGALETEINKVVTTLNSQATAALKEVNDRMARVEALTREVDEARDRAKEDLAAIGAARRSAEQSAAITAVAGFSKFFEEERTLHSAAAARWLAAASLLVGIGTLLAVLLFVRFELNPLSPPSVTTMPEMVRELAARLVIVTLIVSAAAWSARNYSIHRHNETVNKHRHTALRTFEGFVASTKDPRVQDAILLQAAHAAFAPQSTGFAASDGEPSTPAPLVALLQSESGR